LIFFWSSTVPGLLHAAKRWVRVEKQGLLDQLWGEWPAAEAPAAINAIDEQGEEIVDFVFHAQNRVEDIALVQDMGFEVNDGNEPAPKNIPTLFGAPALVRGGDLIAERFCMA
jgi:hypothetical protein